MATPGAPVPQPDVQEQLRRRIAASKTPAPSPSDPRLTTPIDKNLPIGGSPPSDVPTSPRPPVGVNDPVFNADPRGPVTPPAPGDPKLTTPAAPNMPGGRALDLNQPTFNGPSPGGYASPGAPIASSPMTNSAPQISSAQGGDKGLEDKFFQFLSANGYTTGASNRGAGFFAGGGQYRGNLADLVAKFNQQTGMSAKTVAGHDDQIDFGSGARDVLTAGANDWWLSPGSGPSSPTGAAGAASGAAGAGAAGAAGGFNDQVRQALMARIGALSQPFDPNDPSISQPMAAARLEADRATEMERKALAERRAANGDTSASLEQGIQQSAERNAVGLGNIRSQLMGRAIESNKQQLQQYLAMALQSGDNEQARAIQLKIAEMNDQLQRLGLAQHQSQWDDSFGLDAGKFQYDKDRDLALFGSGAL